MLSTLTILLASAAYAQNYVSITQNGGGNNSASVTQSGEGNSVSISQTGGATTDDPKPGNRVSLRVPRGTRTTINQQNVGPNSVEISQEGQATATITQSSQTGENAIHTLPVLPDHRGKTRPSKSWKRQ
ncbi:curlin repeat-containing protein [Spirosoma aerophilum]